ncbi:hypothetical protein [Accumulibacter sp.]|uniref:hypothetical protein n=1 Tax=Accumulibacter sp. TaxID=2053492 RepID=UPI0028C3E3C3|nr:hypothetical protein [Accumulibacter sp.]
MSQAFEKFLQGEDCLARLLCALPAYTPSAEFEAAFARAAVAAQKAIQTESAAAQKASPSPAAPTAAGVDINPSAFEPPARLEARFLKMAASIESAQTPRREAILTGIAKGDSPQAMLGAAIQPATEEWLRAQAPAPRTQPAAPSPPVHKRAFLGFRWFDLRLAALACVIAAVCTQLVLTYLPEPQQVAMREVLQKALGPRDALNEAKLAQNSERSLDAAQGAPDQANTAMRQGQPDQAALVAREPAAAGAAAPLKKNAAGATAPRTRLADAADGPKSESPSPPLATLDPPASAAPAEAIGAPAHGLASEAAKPAVVASGRAEQTRADALSAQPARSAAAMTSVQAARPEKTAPGAFPDARKEETRSRERAIGEIAVQETQKVEREVPAAKSLGTAASKPRPAMVAAAPGIAAAATPMTRLRAVDSSISATLADDPARVAARLPSRPAGAVWTVYSSQPRQPELDRWLETLRQHMPETSRPARFELIKDGASPVANHLRIVPPTLSATR